MKPTTLLRSFISANCLSRDRHTFALLVLSFCLCLVSTVNAVPITSDGGFWHLSGSWTPATVPTNGDAVIIDTSTTVSGTSPNENQAFGSATEDSIWTAGTLTIQAGGTLTNHSSGGFSFIKDADEDLRLQGSGTFVNMGSFEHQDDLFRLNSVGTTFDNQGAYLMSEHDARLYFGTSATRFNNLPGGTVEVNLPASTDIARIYGLNDTDGQYLNSGGSPITFTRGILNFAPPEGGDLTDAAFANLFGSRSADSTLRIGGGFESIVLSTSTLTRVEIGDALRAHSSGTTTINVTASGGARWNSGAMTIPTGRQVLNLGSFVKVADADVSLTGGGTFENQGTFEHQDDLFRLQANTSFDNKSTYLMNEHDSRLYFAASGSRFNNLTGGTVEVNLPLATNIARIYGLNDADGQYLNSGGSPIIFTKGILNFAPPEGGNLTDAGFSNLFGARSVDSKLRIGGAFESIVLSSSDLTRVEIGDALRAHSSGTTTINVTATGGARWDSGTMTIPAGRKVLNLGEFVKVDDADVTISGGGTFENQGTFEHQDDLIRLQTNTAFDNKSTYLMTENDARLYFAAAGTSYNNLADGVLRSSAPSGLTRMYGPGAGTLNNLGTIEVTSAELDIDTNVVLPQFSSNTLTGGTWKVLAGAGSATLDLHPADAGITTIGTGAKVVMGGATPLFPQLSSGSLNVEGTFGVHDSQVYGLTGLTMGTNGILEFGLQGIDEGGTLTTGIQVVGPVNFDDTQVDIIDLGGIGVGTYRIMEFTSAFGSAAIGDTPGGFSFSLIQGTNFLDLSVVELPEPSSFLLLGWGALGLMRHTRRRKAKAASQRE